MLNKWKRNHLLAAWGRPRLNCYFIETKTVDYYPFWQQATEQPTVSPEVTMGGADSDVHTVWDEGPNITQMASQQKFNICFTVYST